MRQSIQQRLGQSVSTSRAKRSAAFGAAIAAVGLASQALAVTYVYTPTPTTTDLWSAGTDWSAIPLSAATTQLTFSGGTLADGFVNTNTNDITGLFSLNILDLNGAGPGTGAATINLNSVSPSTGLNFVINGATNPTVNLGATGAALTYNVNQALTLTNNTTFAGVGTANFLFNGGITSQGAAGTGAGATLIKTGASVMTLGGTSSLGSLLVGSNLGVGGTLKAASGANLTVGNGTAGQTFGVGVITAAPTGNTNGTLDLSAAASLSVNVATINIGTTSLNGSQTANGTLILPASSNLTASTSFVSGFSGGTFNTGVSSAISTANGVGTTTIRTPTMTIGGAKSVSSFTVGTGGTLDIAGIGTGRTNLNIGNGTTTNGGSGAASGTINVAGGVLNAKLGTLIVGGRNTTLSTASYGGTLTLSNSASNHLDLSAASTTNGVLGIGVATGSTTGSTTTAGSATGTVTIGGLDSTSSIVSTNNGTAIFLGNNAAVVAGNAGVNGTGTLNLNGSGTLTITTTGSAIAGGTGTSTVNFNGTTLRAGASSSNWITGVTNANVAEGGLNVDTNGFALTTAQIFKHGGVAATDGGLTKSGLGSLTLGGASTYNGPTTVNAGLLNVNGSVTSNVTVASGASLGGIGTINGSLTFGNNTELQVTPTGSFLTATTVNAAGSVVTISPLGLIPGTPTTILSAPGGITGTIGTNFKLLSRGTLSEISNTTLQVMSTGAAALVWSGSQSSAWDIQTSQNWLNGASPDVFFNLDNVTFNDSAANRNVNIAGNVTPGSVTIDHSTGADYVITGASIIGNTGLTKNGTGTAAIANNNTYTGGTTINAGTLQLGDGVNAAGSLGTGTVTDNATLAVNFGANNGSLANVVTGTGGLNKNGAGTLSVSAVNTYIGTTNINAGTLQLDGTGTLGTGPVVNNAALVANTTTTLANNISGSGTVATAGTAVLTVTGTNSYAGGTTIIAGTTLNVGNGGTTGTLGSGPITNTGTLAFNHSDPVNAPVLSGAGTVNQVGAGTLTLAGTNSVGAFNAGIGAVTGAVIVPSGASFNVGTDGTKNFIIGSAPGATSGNGTFNASAATAFTANVATLGVGITANSAGIASGTLNLPSNSTINATTAVTIGESGGTRAGDNNVVVASATTGAGGITSVTTPTFQVGNGKSTSALTLGAGNTLQIAGIGVGGRANLYVNNMAIGGGGGNFAATADLSAGVINASLSSLYVSNQSYTLSSTVNLIGILTLSNSAANHLDISGLSFANSLIDIANPNSGQLNAGVVAVGRIDGVGNTGSVNGTLTINNLDATSTITSTNNGTAIIVGGTNSGNTAGGINSSGTVNLNGGTLKIVTTGAAIAGGVIPLYAPATAVTSSVVNFNGTTLVAGADSSNWIHDLSNANSGGSGAIVGPGGAIIDTGGFNVTVPQQFVSAGGTDGGLTKKGAGTLTITAVSTYTGATTVQGGTLKAPAAVYPSLLSGTGVNITGNGAKFAFDYTGTGSPVAQVKTILTAGYNQATQFSSGAIRSTPLPAGRILGYGDDGASTVTVMLTLPGDANLDGAVNFNDFLVLQNNFNQAGTRFDQGNFNYDGATDFNDFLVLQNNFGQSVTGAAVAFTRAEYDAVMSITSNSAVPEPASLTLLGLGAAGMLRRRRRAI